MTKGAKSGPRTSILVVDDEPIVLQSLAAWLRQEGYDVETARGAKEALEFSAERRYDIALVDIKMPDIDGLELQSQLAAADPDLTIIIMTAYASVDTAVEALKSGATDYLTKPLDIEELKILVAKALRYRQLEQENIHLKTPDGCTGKDMGLGDWRRRHGRGGRIRVNRGEHGCHTC